MVRFAHGIEGEREAKAPFPSFACRQRGIRVVGFALFSSYPIFCRSFRQMRHGRNIFGAKLVFPHIAATNSGITFLEVATFMAEKRLHGLFLDVSPIISLAVAATFWRVCGRKGEISTPPLRAIHKFPPLEKSWHLLLSPLPPTTLFPSSPFYIPSKLEGGRAMRTTRVGWVGGGHFYTGH